MSAYITVDLTPLDKALKALPEKAEIAATQAVAQAAHVVEAETKRNLTRYSHKKGTPTPSPPGEPPALVTGTLRRSIEVRTYPNRLTPYAEVGPTVIYGRAQELGYPPRNLPARPYLKPAVHLAIHSGKVQAVFTQAWTRAIHG